MFLKSYSSANLWIGFLLTLAFAIPPVLPCFADASTQNPAPHETCASPVAGLTAWWQFEGNGEDRTGTNAAILLEGSVFTLGKVGQAVGLDGDRAHVRIAATPELNVGSGEGLTIEGWINPAQVETLKPVVEWNNGSSFGAHFWISVVEPGTMFANLIDTTGTWHGLLSAGAVIASNEWQHVALTYDKTSGMAAFYRNGIVVTQQVVGTFTPQTSYDLIFGRRVSGPHAGGFRGGLDEISIYDRALPTDEIAAIFDANALGKCTEAIVCHPAPTGLVAFWPLDGDGTDLTGQNPLTLFGDISFSDGKVGETLRLATNGNYAQATASPSLNVGTGPGFTLEGWINPDDVTDLQPIIEWNNGGVFGTHFWISIPEPGTLFANIVDVNGAWHGFKSVGGVVTTGEWQHVALTYNPSTGTAAFYRG